MIITSVGLLVVAFVLLVVGIVKSGVSYLVFSALLTLVAGGFLYASFIYYRNKALADGATPPNADGAIITPGYPAAYTGGRGPVTSPTVATEPVGFAGYESLNAKQAAEYANTLNLDELHGLRRFEVEHDNRKTVLAAIDGRIDAIVSVRKSLSQTS